MDENPSLLVTGRCGVTSDSPGVLSIVDAYSGKEVKSFGSIHSIVQVLPLPYTDSKERHLHLLIDDEKRAHLYPHTPQAVEIFKSEFTNIYWYSVEEKNCILRGHAVKSNCVLDVADE